jgi:hypothetical protein
MLHVHATAVLCALMVTMTATIVGAQEASRGELSQFQRSRNDINRTAMMVLGCWAIANIAVGTYGTFRAQGKAKYFHQFNAIWNVVNLGLAVSGYISAVNNDPATMTGVEILKDFSFLQNFLQLNAGLDVAYIVAGLYLRERSGRASNPAMMKGYGNSLLVQGGFLLVFDVALFLIHQHNAAVNLYPLIERFVAGGIGAGVVIRL